MEDGYPNTGEYFWNSQTLGVGHFAKEAEKMAFSNGDVIAAVMEANNQYDTARDVAENGSKKSVEVLMGKEARRIYDTPNKGILWGWEVSGYVWTKAIASGVFLVALLKDLFFGTTLGMVLSVSIIAFVVIMAATAGPIARSRHFLP